MERRGQELSGYERRPVGSSVRRVKIAAVFARSWTGVRSTSIDGRKCEWVKARNAPEEVVGWRLEVGRSRPSVAFVGEVARRRGDELGSAFCTCKLEFGEGGEPRGEARRQYAGLIGNTKGQPRCSPGRGPNRCTFRRRFP
ncbi:hypothetical protein KM043_012226 [Ampulex compressa]|nr:hypothetical protein KM043_012226 [Ampulex compressa]